MLELKDRLEIVIGDLGVLIPEMILIAGSILLLITGLIFKKSRIIKAIFLLVLVITGYALEPLQGIFFRGAISMNSIGFVMKWVFLATSAALLLFSRDRDHNEYYFLTLAVLVGSFFMLQSTHLLLIYISIELTSYGSYLLTALKSDPKASEAAFKYLLFGGVSSALMLYGISLWFGDTGSFYVADHSLTYLGEAGIALFLAGLLFKTSVVPFHIWTPGTYQAADTDAVAFFSVVPKLAGFGMVYNVFRILDIELNDNLMYMVAALALLTVLWGTFTAILQKNIKRLVAFGAIAHSGFLLPLAVIRDPAATDAFMYYATVYAIMNLGLFYMINQMERGMGDNIKLMDLQGLSNQNGFTGAMMVIILVSLIGLPPTAGFTAKLLLFSNVWMAQTGSAVPIWLIYLILGVLSSVISFFFYFQLPYHYFLKRSDDQVFKFSITASVVTTIFAVTLLYLFLKGNIFHNFKVMSQSILLMP